MPHGQVRGPKRAMFVSDSPVTESALSSKVKRPASSAQARKKILFVTNTNEYGGAERHLLELTRRLQESGVELSVLCLDDDFFTERLDPNQGVRVITCRQLPKTLREWIRLFRDFRPDVVVFIYGWLWCLPSIVSVGAWLAGIRRRVSIQHLIAPPLVLPPK